MLEKFKNTSLLTKLLYLLALIIFVAWVIPKMSSYYSSVNAYQQNSQALKTMASKHGISTNPQTFSAVLFKRESELLFSKVSIANLEDKQYKVNITMKKEDLKTFHSFIETISLKYYVKIVNDLEFTSDDETVNVQMILEAF